MDGINIDIEQAVEEGSPEYHALTDLVKETTEAFHRAIPGSQVKNMSWHGRFGPVSSSFSHEYCENLKSPHHPKWKLTCQEIKLMNSWKPLLNLSDLSISHYWPCLPLYCRSHLMLPGHQNVSTNAAMIMLPLLNPATCCLWCPMMNRARSWETVLQWLMPHLLRH